MNKYSPELSYKSGSIDRKKKIKKIYCWPLSGNHEGNSNLKFYLLGLLGIELYKNQHVYSVDKLLELATQQGFTIEESRYLVVRRGRICKMNQSQQARFMINEQRQELFSNNHEDYLKREEEFNKTRTTPTDFGGRKVHDSKINTRTHGHKYRSK